jgi:hypothetical protein
MRIWAAGFLLFLIIGVAAPAVNAQESVDSNEPPTATDTSATTTTTSTDVVLPPRTPAWTHLVRVAATAGPIAFLVLAWMIGIFLHYRLVRREQAQFPAVRGTRAPQTVPMIVSAALFIVPAVLFVIFEVRSRMEISRHIEGVVDQWHPVTARAWTSLLICLVLALIPWLFVRRADTVR